MNKAVLLQLQQEQAKAHGTQEMEYNWSHCYDNKNYENNDIQQDPDNILHKHESGFSKMTENQPEEKEERKTSF